MGQGLWCCECIYWNGFYNCIGCSLNLCLCSCWLCEPLALKGLRGNQCCQCGWTQGLGYSLFCMSQVICIPGWLRDYSIYESIGERRKQIYDVAIFSTPVNPYTQN